MKQKLINFLIDAVFYIVTVTVVMIGLLIQMGGY